jgi:hypothetical protein
MCHIAMCHTGYAPSQMFSQHISCTFISLIYQKLLNNITILFPKSKQGGLHFDIQFMLFVTSLFYNITVHYNSFKLIHIFFSLSLISFGSTNCLLVSSPCCSLNHHFFTLLIQLIFIGSQCFCHLFS